MKIFLIIAVTAAVTWITASFIHGARTGLERIWLISAVKAPGRMALSEIQADMHEGRYDTAKTKIDVLTSTWRRFEHGPDSFEGGGIGDVMTAFPKPDTNSSATLSKP